MGVSADSKRRGGQSLPSTKTSHIGGWRWHRQERQLVWFIGRHGGCGEWGEGYSVTRDMVSQVILSNILAGVRRCELLEREPRPLS